MRCATDLTKIHNKFGWLSEGNNVHIGTNATIMPNVKVDLNCIVGCGAIVTKEVPDNSIFVGCPARTIETIDEYYAKHKNAFDITKQMSSEEKRQYLLKKYYM